jgi:hypothetical protein
MKMHLKTISNYYVSLLPEFRVICVCLRIVMFNTYCVVFLFCFSSSCVPYVASFWIVLFYPTWLGILNIAFLFQVHVPFSSKYKKTCIAVSINIFCRNITIISWNGSSWPWSYGSWNYNYLYNLCLSPLMLWVRIPLREWWTTLCDKSVVTKLKNYLIRAECRVLLKPCRFIKIKYMKVTRPS